MFKSLKSPKECFMKFPFYRVIPALTLVVLAAPVLCSQAYVPGQIYYDSTGYIAYKAGNLPLVLSAPHGGHLKPSSLPNRNCTGCTYVKDAYTQEVAEGLYKALVKQTGCYPHVVINLLHREKLDANRNIGPAADGHPVAEKAWRAYHRFIDSAKSSIVNGYNRGLFLDLHGHGHSLQRIELGYALSASELRLPDSSLNGATLVQESSIRGLVSTNLFQTTHTELLRGPKALGSLLEADSLPAVPSAGNPFPLSNEPYFSGGYNTYRHGSRNDTLGIDAIQVEFNQSVRFDSLSRENLVARVISAVNQFIDRHFEDRYMGNFCGLLSTPEQGSAKNSKALEIYPQPVEAFLQIEGLTGPVEVKINNLPGQTWYWENFTEDRLNVDFLPPGFYLIQFRQGKEVLHTEKFIKR